MDTLVKTGSCSIILGKGHYGKFLDEKQNKLLKVTKINDNHDESKNLYIVRSINNYSDYYSIPDNKVYIIKPDSEFYNYLKQLVNEMNMNIFYGNLECNYVDYAGNKDVLETIGDLQEGDYRFWKSYNVILTFINHILKGLCFLHINKIAHLDIKTENIMVDTFKNQFKIIDFGFCSIEPFDDYVDNIRGTPGYFPKYFSTEKVTAWFPKIKTNDMDLIDGELPMKKNRSLVYKIDSYCFGRVLHVLKYFYEFNLTYSCSFRKNKNKSNKEKIEKIIKSLLDNNVNTRLTCMECFKKYFNN